MYLGSGHFPLSFSSSTYFLTTSWHRCNSDNTASLVIEPSLDLDLLMYENWRSVSKHVLANSSRSLRLESVSEMYMYRKTPKNVDTRKITVIILKFD